MKKLRMIRVMKVELRQNSKANGQSAAAWPGDASDRNGVAVKQETLLLKEIDETNNWARSGAQLYFGWFTLMLTVNGLGAGWLFTHNPGMPRFTFLLFAIFIGLNLMGTIVTYRIRREMFDSDDRIAEVIDSQTAQLLTENDGSRPQSPIPRTAINIALSFTGAALFMLMIFWAILEVWGLASGFSSLVVGSP